MRLLICDDHRLFIDALTMALTDSGHTVVATALDPDDAVAAARQHQPDVCLLDMNFPNGNGLAAIARIHQVSPGTKVVMLSASISSTRVRDAIGQGAQGYVTKAKPVSVILEAVEQARQGELAVDPLLLREVFGPAAASPDPLRALMLLSDREWEVLRFIVDGLSTERMAEELDVQVSTARSHVQNLLTKLGVHSRLQAAALMNAHASIDTWPPNLR